MQVRALKSFAGKYGHIRVGQIFNCEPNYADQLKTNGLVLMIDEKQAAPGPSSNRAIPAAPSQAREEPAPLGKDGAAGDSAHTPAAGAAITSRSLRADLASRKKTSKRSASGETPSSSQDPPAVA